MLHKNKSMESVGIACAALAMLFSAATAQAALIVQNSSGQTVDLPIPTGLGLGDEFHYAFQTTTTIQVSGSTVADYNNHVQAAADATGSEWLNYDQLTWYAMKGTVDVSHIVNAPQAGPVFLYNGTKIADYTVGSDFRNGELLSPLSRTQTGGTHTNSRAVWTRNANGTGTPGHTATTWWIDGSSNADNFKRLYALSETLTVIPEPTSASLLIAALAGIGFMRRRIAG